MRLTKDQSRKRWAEIRALWCEFDPIGVVNSLSGPFDEYDPILIRVFDCSSATLPRMKSRHI